MNESDSARQMMTACAICGEPTEPASATALVTVRDSAGRTGIFAVHSPCIIGVFHPNARTLLDAAPIVPGPA